jgi:hypothetical protein
VVTDHATFAYLCDVYVLEDTAAADSASPDATVMAHPALTGARRAMLAPRCARPVSAVRLRGRPARRSSWKSYDPTYIECGIGLKTRAVYCGA